MISKTGNYTKSIVAFTILSVFVGSMLIKPIHVFFLHHLTPEKVQVLTDQKTISTPGENVCPICDFEFCFFIDHETVDLPKAVFYSTNNISPKLNDLAVKRIINHFQLRAPPAC